MKNQVVINNANIDLTIRKPSDYRPRKGFKLVHVKYIPDVAPTADATHRILGRGYFWGEKGTKELCYVLEIPANEAVPLNRMFENEKAEHRRTEAEMLLSYENVNQDKVCVPAGADGSEESIFYNAQSSEMLCAIKNDEDSTFRSFVFLNRQGYELAEIMEKLNLVRADIERLGHKLEKYVNEYMD